MSQPSPFDAVLEDDTQRILQSALGPACTVMLYDDAGHPHELRALYGQPGVDVQPGQASAPVVNVSPALQLSCRDVQTALGRDLCARDRVTVRNRPYRILSVMDDGYGLLECRLLEAAHV
ncbi:MAG TPA: hypothetical protein H9784_00490 [Candidatus Desulfovibrio intestinavium]|uniref:Uncharacterized protein n=1 Tax=Candidatus Desulfovibrio intestinavium TaxID=2838534 RepID=A0A9D2HLJ0_9BACT|nr:hypothetical protein [Candidatus Desulfovibrio intestinavium]